MRNPLRVLLLDDDSSLLQTLAEYMRNTLLAIVYTAASVPAAIVKFDESGPFDVIVTDYQLPPHTAHDFEEHLRRSQDFTPLILHSSFTQIDESRFHGRSYWGLAPKPGYREIVRKILDHFPDAKKS